jgi:hypothetical protein
MRSSLLTVLSGLSCAAAVAPACGGGAVAPAAASTGGSTATSTTTIGVVTTGFGGIGGAGGGGDGGHPSDVYPAPHPAPPQVVSFGGPVLATPHVVPVFFSDADPTIVSQVTDFLGKVGATSYWAACTQEYGVGPLKGDAAVMLPEAAPASIDDSAIQLWLAAALDADDPTFPAADDQAIYAIHYPPSTTITADFGGRVEQGCVDFGGYHSNITLDPPHGDIGVTYIVMPSCGDFDGFSGIDAITSAESHELVETVTDPYVTTMPAYVEPDEPHLYWLAENGGSGEVGDMCEENLASFTKFPELDYVVQRTWSNASALAGHDPCVPPLPGEVYFNSAPELNDEVAYTLGGATMGVHGIAVPVGHTRTLDLDLFSDGPTPGPWSVSAQELGSQNLLLDVGAGLGQNGQKVHLHITAQSPGQAIFVVSSSPTWSASAPSSTWVGIVNN